jgi:hypothetical protein
VLNTPDIQAVWPIWRQLVDPTTSASLDRIRQYRPLLPLSLSLNYALGGTDPVGYHLVNLLLLVVASLEVYLLGHELLRHGAGGAVPAGRVSTAAVWAAATFAIHPVAGITVNHLSARDLVLMQALWGGRVSAGLHPPAPTGWLGGSRRRARGHALG